MPLTNYLGLNITSADEYIKRSSLAREFRSKDTSVDNQVYLSSEFQSEDFNVSTIFQRIQENSSRADAEDDVIPSDEYDPTGTLKLVEASLHDLTVLRAQVDTAVELARKSNFELDYRFQFLLSDSDQKSNQLMTKLSETVSRSNSSSRAAMELGRTLESAERHRVQAEWGARIMDYIDSFSTNDPEQWDPLFTDPDYLDEAAPIAGQLLEITRHLSGLPILESNVDNIREYCSVLEARLFAVYDSGKDARNIAAMRWAFDTVLSLNGGESLIIRVVESSLVYSDMCPELLAKRVGEGTRTMALLSKTLGRVFKDFRKQFCHDNKNIEKIFTSSTERVRWRLLEALFARKMTTFVDALMDRVAHGDPTAPKQRDSKAAQCLTGTHAWIECLHAFFVAAVEFARTFEEFFPKKADLGVLLPPVAANAFSSQLPLYMSMEEKSLLLYYQNDATHTNDSRATAASAVQSLRRSLVGLPSLEDVVVPEVADKWIDHTMAAMDRCITLSAPSKLMDNICHLSSLLIKCVDGYYRSAVEKVVAHIDHCERSEDVSEPPTAEVARVMAAIMKMTSLISHRFDADVAHLALELSLQRRVRMQYSKHVAFWDGKMDELVDRLIKLYTFYVKLLLKQQGTNEYNAETSMQGLLRSPIRSPFGLGDAFAFSNRGSGATKCCEKGTSWLLLQKTAAANFGEKYRRRFLTPLPWETIRLLKEHWLTCKFAIVASSVFRRDVEAWVEVLRTFEDSALLPATEALLVLPSLYSDVAENVVQVVSACTLLKQSELAAALQCRSDYHTAKSVLLAGLMRRRALSKSSTDMV